MVMTNLDNLIADVAVLCAALVQVDGLHLQAAPESAQVLIHETLVRFLLEYRGLVIDIFNTKQ